MSKAFKLLRQLRNLSLSEMAKTLICSEGYLSEIENGKKTPSFSLIERMAKLFSCSPSNILRLAESLEKSEEAFREKLIRMALK